MCAFFDALVEMHSTLILDGKGGTLETGSGFHSVLDALGNQYSSTLHLLPANTSNCATYMVDLSWLVPGISVPLCMSAFLPF